ncbi:MAG: ABC transporter permease [Alphaproteobacteria bacterium]|nr:ABC transporter permease [Alphaproteobacteria bacterium]
MMGLSLRRLLAVMRKEFTQLRRDRATFGMMIMIPIMQLVLFGFAINTDPKNLPTVLLLHDRGAMARSVIASLEHTGYFKIDHEVQSDNEGQKLLQEGRTQFVITIPENFGRDIIRGMSPQILIETDATDPTASSGALAALHGVLDTWRKDKMTGALYEKQTPQPFGFTVHKLYNPEGFSRYNIVPGMMGIVLTMTGVMMTALALTREKERGTIENLLSMPVSPFEVMAGKIAPYVIIGYIQSALIVIAAKLLFDVPILGSLWLLSALLIIFLICNLALGFTISTAAQNQTQAMQLSFAPFLPSVLLSGFMFPFKGMPEWAQTIGNILPATYFIRITRGVLLKGTGFTELWPNIWPMALFMFFIVMIAMRLYKKTMD